MSRAKPGESSRGKAVTLPKWWLDALNRRCGDATAVQLAEQLSAAVRRQPPFHQSSVGDFLRGKVTTDVMMGAFLVLFPDLPPPIFMASSYEEAHRIQQLSRSYAKQHVEEIPKLQETIEDTGELRAKKSSRTKRNR